MRRSVSLLIFFVVFSSCFSNRVDSCDKDLRILKEALVSRKKSDLEKAISLIDEKIKMDKNETFYAQKIELLIAYKDYQKALETTKLILEKNPDYVEMITINCILSKLVSDENYASDVYKKSSKQLNDLIQNSSDFNIISSLLILNCIFDDFENIQKNYSFLMLTDLSETEKNNINYIINATELELFQIFGIY